MSDKDRRLSVSRDDVLTSRGANPRTGIISPYISEETCEGGEENDYVHVRSVQKEATLTTGAQERWRQDELGWSLIECVNDQYVSMIDTNSSRKGNLEQEHPIVAKPSAREQIEIPTSKTGPGEVNMTGGMVIHDASPSTTRGSSHVSARVQAASKLNPANSPEGLFRIPRKEVGGTRSSSMPTPTKGQDKDRPAGSTRFVPGTKNMTSRSFLPAHLHAEDIALGFHAYPSSPSRDRNPKCNQAAPPLRVEHTSKVDIYRPYYKDQKLSPKNWNGPSISSLAKSGTQELNTTYRRPPELLPARLRGNHASHLAAPLEKAHAGLRVPNNVNIPKTAERRPPIKRVPGLAAVPLAGSPNRVRDSDPAVNETIPVSFLDRRASGRLGNALHSSPAPSLSLGITCTARKLLDPPEAISHATTNSNSENRSEQALPLLTVNGVPLGEQPPCVQPPKPLAKTQSSPLSEPPSPKEKDSSGPKLRRGTVVRRGSMRAVKETWDLLAEFIREVDTLIDIDHIRGQVLGMIRHAVITFQHTPWALRTLMSSDAKVWDSLRAVRYMLLTTVYLVIMLSLWVRVWRLLVDIGLCFWYPVSLVVMMARWMLLH